MIVCITQERRGQEHAGEGHVEVEAGLGGCSPRRARSGQRLGHKRLGRFSPRAALLTSQFRTSSLQNHEREDISVVSSHRVCGNLLWRPQEMNTLFPNSAPTIQTGQGRNYQAHQSHLVLFGAFVHADPSAPSTLHPLIV